MFLVNASFSDTVRRGLIRYEELKGAVVRRLHTDNNGSVGMTLVELMVAVGITTVVMALSTLIFTGQFKSYRTGHAVKTTEADIQKAMELVRDDLTLAGWGVKPQMAFYFVDGGNTTADQIYVNDIALINSQNATQVLLMVDSGLTRCGGCRRYAGASPDSIDHGGSLNITGHSTTHPDLDDAVPVLVWADDGNQTRWRTISGNSGGFAPTTGFSVQERWVTPAIQYSVFDDATSHVSSLRRLDKDTSGAQPMAEDVVDLQVVYGDNSTTPTPTSSWTPPSVAGANMYGALNCAGINRCQFSPFDASTIRWVNLFVVTRSAERTRPADDPGTGSCRPAVANRSAGTVAGGECGYTYRVYVTRITPMGNIH